LAKLEGKVAVVTGASKGIGAAIAKALAAADAAVVVNYTPSKDGADAVVRTITGAGGKAIAKPGDVSKADQARDLVEAAATEFGRLDILVNNSGIWDIVPIEDMTEDQFHRSFGVNVLGALLTTQAALKHLGEGSSIINVSSNATTIHPPGSSVDTGTKSALEGITSVLATELGPRKIRVNAVLPRMVDIESNRTKGFIGSPIEEYAISQTPLGRIGQPDDVADVAVFLASDDARWMTGERLVASGGFR
jgi:3-oxoacyl-[acyl-carrier protein] reductase